MKKVEIACNSYASAINAVKGGAHRIELFENHKEGGCTPSAGMIQKVKKLHLPLYVMIRPRGGDFYYSNEEIDIMHQDIEFCKQAGVTGVVFGCLTHSGTVDKELCRELLKSWHGPATFHRAIDRTPDIIQAAHTITDMGFERILSSGGATHVMKGLDALQKLQNEVGEHLIVMPGAGVTSANAEEILHFTGCMEIHASCKHMVDDIDKTKHPLFDDSVEVSDPGEITRLVRTVAGLHL